MSFVDDLALGSPYHRAFCADTSLKIEPLDNSAAAQLAFGIIVNATRKAALSQGYVLRVVKSAKSNSVESVTIELPR